MKNLVLALIFACVVVPASTHDQNAYITNLDSNTVSVIATATNTVIGLAIPVGLSPLGVVVTPDRSKVYVANHASNTVSVIDTATNSVSATIPVGASPFGVAATPDGNKVYVAHDSTPGAVSSSISRRTRWSVRRSRLAPLPSAWRPAPTAARSMSLPPLDWSG